MCVENDLQQTDQPKLVIRLLGEFLVSASNRPLSGLTGDRLQSLLTFLLLHRTAPQSRRYLSFLLWPDSTEAQARSNLRNLLFNLRQALPEPDRYLVSDATTIQWRVAAPIVLDVAEFQAALTAAQQAAQARDDAGCAQWLQEAITHYGGDLLRGNYDDWLIAEREQLHQEFAEALRALVALWERLGNYAAALRPAQRYVQADPLNESAYIQLMRLHAQMGDRAAVQRLYQSCAAVLRRELDVEPSPSTQRAYAEYLRLAPAPLIDGALPASKAQTLPPVETPVALQMQPSSSHQSTWRPRALPIPATPFLGRELELAQIAERLADDNCRLLTLLGQGGIGKTRLALQVALGHQPVFADGVAYVSLAGVEAGEQMAAALAASLNAPYRDSEDAQEQLLSILRTRELLLVIDNFEHLVGDASLLPALLAEAPCCKLLVTSRQQLDLVEEWVYELQGLPLPQVADGEANSAIALFVRSARRSSHTFVLDESNRTDVIRICRMVGGMPLAIELAAAWVRLLSCREIVAEMGRSLDLLAAAQHNLPARHRSIRAVFDYSWQLLSKQEQQALAALAVFQGGFGRDAALAVAQAGLPMLLALAAKSLVQRAEAGRYMLHELVRQYAAERLAQSQQWAAVHDRHLAYIAQLGEEAREQLYGVEQREWLVRLSLEHDNMRVALEWALREDAVLQADDADTVVQQRREKALRIVTGLPRFWNGRGYLREGRSWLERGLALLPQGSVAVRAEALSTLGWLLNMLGETARAKTLQLESLALFRACGDERGIAEALDTLGDSAWVEGALAEAKAYYSEELVYRRRLGNESAIGLALYSLGRLEVDCGSLEEAQPLLEEAVDRLRRIGEARGVALTLNGLGRVALRRGQPAEAESLVRQALVTFAELGNLVDIPECLEELAFAADASGRLLRTARLLGAAAAMRSITGAIIASDERLVAALLRRIAADPQQQAALQEGAHFSQEQAVAYALAVE